MLEKCGFVLCVSYNVSRSHIYPCGDLIVLDGVTMVCVLCSFTRVGLNLQTLYHVARDSGEGVSDAGSPAVLNHPKTTK